MRIQTGAFVIAVVAVILSGCVAWSSKEKVRIDVTGPALESNQREADMRCAKYDNQVAVLKSTSMEAPGVRHDVFECVEK